MSAIDYTADTHGVPCTCETQLVYLATIEMHATGVIEQFSFRLGSVDLNVAGLQAMAEGQLIYGEGFGVVKVGLL